MFYTEDKWKISFNEFFRQVAGENENTNGCYTLLSCSVCLLAACMRKGKRVPLWHALVLSPRHSPQEVPQEVVVEGVPPLLAQPKTKDTFSYVICNHVPSQS